MWSRRGLRRSALSASVLAIGLAACGSAAPSSTAHPSAAAVPAPGAAALDRSLTAGVTVGPKCAVTGWDGVVPDAKGDQCHEDGLSATPAGLTLTSTAGQLADGDQQNALFNRFDAHAGGFTIHARLAGPINQLTADYQQIVLWFGPDTKNFVKIEAEHGNGTGPSDPDPHMTMYWDEAGKPGPVGIISLPALTTTQTLDLYLFASTTYQITAGYSLDGGKTRILVGHPKTPKDFAAWFSKTASMAGILVSNSGSQTPFKATFTQFDITKS